MSSEPYQQVLASAGFPTDVLVLDWETYADKDYTLRKKDTYYPDYVADPRFEILGLGYQALGLIQTPSYFARAHQVGPMISEFQREYGENLERCTVVGQNLKFDVLILFEKFGVLPRFTADTLDIARHLDARGRHDLDYLAKKHGSPQPKGDTSEFFELHVADLDEEKWGRLTKYCTTDIDITAFLFKKLLPQVTRPNVELRLMAQTLRMFIDPHVVIDMELGKRLVKGMTDEIDNVVAATRKHGILAVQPARILKTKSDPPLVREITREDISKNGLFMGLLSSALPEGESIPMKQGKKELIPAFSKDDDGCKYLLHHPVEAVRDLMEARLAIKSWPKEVKRVETIMRQAECRRGLIGIPLHYYGGHTGRFAGTGGWNPQNFGARDVHTLLKQVGKMLRAEYGYVFGTGDLSQIEARKIAWLAGQTDLLEQFARGEDIYSDFAQNQVFHEETRKPRKDDSPELTKQLSIRRDFGKISILQMGFGAGGKSIYDQCRANKDLRPLFDSGVYDLEFCFSLVNKYRSRYNKIKAYWGEVERAFRFVTKYRDQVTEVTHNGHGVKFHNRGGTTVITLPSGRCMFYPDARVDSQGKGNISYRPGGTRKRIKLYGGKIAENLTQASARDVFCDGLLRLEDAGFPVLFSVHDAAITLVRDDDQAGERLAEMHRLQTVIEPWYAGLPVATEGKLVGCYEK